jgi:hypothetical protein
MARLLDVLEDFIQAVYEEGWDDAGRRMGKPGSAPVLNTADHRRLLDTLEGQALVAAVKAAAPGTELLR